MEKEALSKIGLTGNEAKIYLALLKIGSSLVGGIVEKTNLNRTNIYDLLKKLTDKGLVSYVIKNNKKYFRAAEPNKILRYLEEKEEGVREDKRLIKEILPQLNSIKPNAKKTSVEVYEGKEGLKTILEDIIKSKEDIQTYGSEGNFSKILKFYFKHYLKRLEKNKIKMRVIFNYNDGKKPFDWKFAEARYLPKEYKTPTETTLYGEKTVIFLLTEDPRAILINNKEITDSYKKYFNILWGKGKKQLTS